MKYVFLLLLLAVAGGGYWYYGKMEQNYDRDVRILEGKSTLAYDELSKREAEALTAYEQSLSELGRMEAAYDAKTETVREEAARQLQTLRDAKVSGDLPGSVNNTIKRRMSDLQRESDKLQADLQAKEQTFLREEKALLAKMADNERTLADKASAARAKLEGEGSAAISSKGIRKAELEQQIAVERAALSRVNQELRTKVEELRVKFVRDERLSYQRLDEINREMGRTYARYETGAGQPAISASKSNEVLTRIEESYREVRRQYQNDANRLNEQIGARMGEWRSVVGKAGRLAKAHDEEMQRMKAEYEQNRLYVKIIGISLSIVLLIVTVIVFAGSRRVEEQPRSPY